MVLKLISLIKMEARTSHILMELKLHPSVQLKFCVCDLKTCLCFLAEVTCSVTSVIPHFIVSMMFT